MQAADSLGRLGESLGKQARSSVESDAVGVHHGRAARAVERGCLQPTPTLAYVECAGPLVAARAHGLWRTLAEVILHAHVDTGLGWRWNATEMGSSVPVGNISKHSRCGVRVVSMEYFVRPYRSRVCMRLGCRRRSNGGRCRPALSLTILTLDLIP